MDFSTVKELIVDSKKVKSIDIGGKRAWSALKTFTITYNLPNCTSSNTATTIIEGSSYISNITCNSTMLHGCTITMGGVSLPSAFKSTGSKSGTITIDSVTGDIVITAITA